MLPSQSVSQAYPQTQSTMVTTVPPQTIQQQAAASNIQRQETAHQLPVQAHIQQQPPKSQPQPTAVAPQQGVPSQISIQQQHPISVPQQQQQPQIPIQQSSQITVPQQQQQQIPVQPQTQIPVQQAFPPSLPASTSVVQQQTQLYTVAASSQPIMPSTSVLQQSAQIMAPISQCVSQPQPTTIPPNSLMTQMSVLQPQQTQGYATVPSAAQNVNQTQQFPVSATYPIQSQQDMTQIPYQTVITSVPLQQQYQPHVVAVNQVSTVGTISNQIQATVGAQVASVTAVSTPQEQILGYNTGVQQLPGVVEQPVNAAENLSTQKTFAQAVKHGVDR